MTGSQPEPLFIDTSAGRVLAVVRMPADARHCVLFVAPFGEEMNKSRRQFAITAQALERRGYATILVDLFGTGDSAGEFAAATWVNWKESIRATLAWAVDNLVAVDAMIATRLGCILATESLCDTGYRVHKSVFWQPVINGRQFMTQFLRLRVAASMMQEGNESVDDLKARLSKGETLEVAGYELSSHLWSAVEGTDLLQQLGDNLGHLMVAEVGRARDSGLSPAGRRLVAAASQCGIKTDSCRVGGEPFWQVSEIVVNPELCDATVDFIVAEDSL